MLEELDVEDSGGGSVPPPPLVVRCPVRALLHCGDDHIDESSSSSDKGEEEIDRAKAPSNDTGEAGGAVYCPDCEMWLNGPIQWEDHKIGKKHQKNVQKKAGGAFSTQEAGGSQEVRAATRPAKGKQPSPDKPTECRRGCLSGWPPRRGQRRVACPFEEHSVQQQRAPIGHARGQDQSKLGVHRSNSLQDKSQPLLPRALQAV